MTQASLLKKKDGRLKKSEKRICEFALEMSRATEIKSLQHGCLSMTRTRTVQIDILMWNGEGLRHTWNYKKLRDVESRRNSLIQGRVHQLTVSINAHPWKHVHTRNIIQTEQILFIYLEIHMYACVPICVCACNEYLNKKRLWIWECKGALTHFCTHLCLPTLKWVHSIYKEPKVNWQKERKRAPARGECSR